ncbi:hypothetical protein ACFE04_010572 [Oxalis oulophora]
MAKSDRLSGGGYHRKKVDMAGGGEYAAAGSSEHLNGDIALSDGMSGPTRKSINLNAGTFRVPMQVHTLANMTPAERKDLEHRFKLELEQIQILQKKIGMHRVNGPSLSDVNNCSNKQQNGRQTETFRQSFSGKKMTSSNQNSSGCKRGYSGRFEAAKPVSVGNALVMKQCDTLLKRLMSHQYAWIFNIPVDVVKLNIPDYFTVIKRPMDLGTIKQKLSSGVYSSPLEFLDDVRLTFTNAMTYNPPTNDAYIMADTMSKFFEQRWKPIGKKVQASETQSQPLLSKPVISEEVEITKSMPVNKKQKVRSADYDEVPKPVKQKMNDADRLKLGREIELLLGELPLHVIDFLKDHSSKGKDCEEDEFEIDIDNLGDDTMFTLRKLLDDYLLEKQKNQAKGEPCEIEMQNVSGLSNSSMPHGKVDELADEDVDIGENEPPVSSYPPVHIEKDLVSSSSSESDSDDDSKSPIPGCESKVPEPIDSAVKTDVKMYDDGDHLDKTQSVSGLDQLEQTFQPKPSSVESVSRQDGDSEQSEKQQVSPGKLYRAAVLKGRFAETILKAREKTLTVDDKRDPEKLRKVREELELQKKKEKARLEAEAKAAKDAQRLAEEKAAVEAKRKLELEREAAREAARQALLQMEKTVEINENSRFLEDLEMLRTAPAEQLLSSANVASPDQAHDSGLGSFNFGRGSNPLEQLGLFMKIDEEEEDADPLPPKELLPINDNGEEDAKLSSPKELQSVNDTEMEDSGFQNFGRGSNPLEQLGLFMKIDEEEEDAEPLPPKELLPINDNGEEDAKLSPPKELQSVNDTEMEDSGFQNFGRGSNPLEQLGLFMKIDEKEEDAEPLPPNELLEEDAKLSPPKQLPKQLQSVNDTEMEFSEVLPPKELQPINDNEEEATEPLPPKELQPVNDNEVEDAGPLPPKELQPINENEQPTINENDIEEGEIDVM